MTGGFVMRGVKFRSHMNLRELILLRRRYVNVVAGEGGLGMIFMLESIGTSNFTVFTVRYYFVFNIHITVFVNLHSNQYIYLKKHLRESGKRLLL